MHCDHSDSIHRPSLIALVDFELGLLLARRLATYPDLFFFSSEGKNKIRDLSFMTSLFRHACFSGLARPSRVVKPEGQGVFEKEGRVARNEWVARATTQHMSLPARLEERGPLPDRTGRAERASLGKRGREIRRFVAWSFFTARTARSLCASSTSHPSDDGWARSRLWGFQATGTLIFGISFCAGRSVCLLVCKTGRAVTVAHETSGPIDKRERE